MLNASELRKAMQGATAISDEVISHIYKERWLQIWVPQAYGGLGCDFKTGLLYLYDWAKIDGSLGWMLTLCAGANYFSRNMQPNTAKALFASEYTCFGGSGMLGGTADEQADGTFVVHGQWEYATGAPYLSHFTLNAKLLKQGKPVVDDTGTAVVHSFIIPKSQVNIIPNWKSMGMKATGTYSFVVKEAVIPADYRFVYDVFYTDDAITKIPFRLFADLTLLVNYLGMAAHFMEEAANTLGSDRIYTHQQRIQIALEGILTYAIQLEGILEQHLPISAALEEEIHHYGRCIVEQLIPQVIQVYTQLGIKGTQVDQPIHQVFCDFFTATQHANFRAEVKK
ncbi:MULTISPECIES: hypothetical protein [unclassified Myroides]|uniref:hypothetical protein n=1 Tax=unclassified Myroides TaxID=2642485 RepID=UPI0015FA8643|nr:MULTISPECIES: hypothetical protein [unclassified Myroides]MBB1150497.1 hypothetical protein [Myroides sp. NP-2]MDM1407468.1 hypothetical protein [Myroides sp. DF42-4-2]